MKKLNAAILGLALSLGSFTADATVHTILASSGFTGNNFSPSSLAIPLGDTVLFQLANGSHNTISLGIPSGAAPWNAPLDGSNPTFQYVPAVVGTYNYHCSFHPGMNGSITVTGGGTPATPTVLPAGPITGCANALPVLTATSTGATTYQWKLNNNNIPSATNANYTPASSGVYTVVATNTTGSSAPSAAVLVTANEVPVVTATPSTLDFCLSGMMCDTLALTTTMTGTTFSILVPGAPPATGVGANPTFCVSGATSSSTFTVMIEGTASGCTGSFPVTVNLIDPPIVPAFSMTGTGTTYNFSIPAASGVTYTWIWGDNTANGSGNTATHTYAAPGSYNVLLVGTNAAGCTDTLGQTLTILSTSDIPGLEGFSFGPNPASNLLTVNTGNHTVELSLLDASGRLVRKLSTGTASARETFDLSGMTAGMYLLQIRSKEVVSTQKLLIQ
ncbi:MAG: T9SS type A sorting domain-containing protein [Sphingobacteriales bacterium]|nr:MAG: T9SS type A sorting domain-containing protein [Sphingobacteriales bacterium]